MATGSLLVALVVLLHVLRYTQSTQALALTVTDKQPTSATVSWTASNDISGILISKQGNFTSKWQSNNGVSERVFNNLTEHTEYEVCITQRADDNISESIAPECEQFTTPYSTKSITAFACAGFLLLSFCILTILDLVCGSVRPDKTQQKQDELLEVGNKTFKRRSAKRNAAQQKKKKKKKGEAEDVADNDVVEEIRRYSMLDDLDDKNSETDRLHDFEINKWLESGSGMPPTFDPVQNRNSAVGSVQDGSDMSEQHPKLKAMVSFEDGT